MPSSEDLYGNCGVHHSGDITFDTSGPSASAALGNSSALEMDAIFGAKPSWWACRQNVMKSGGIGAACRISTLALLNLEMIGAKSESPSV